MRTEFVETPSGLRMRVLSAGEPGAPALLLLHGFPELAYSWRHVMPQLAASGYRVIAPDQRGYGGTTGAEAGYDADLAGFGVPALVRDALALLHALEVARVDAVIGHDFGSPVAAWCALIRPDVFRAALCMSAPFAGPPGWRADTASDIHTALRALDPPRRHYQHWFADPGANDDMLRAPQGLPAFLRAYFHCKSGDWAGNRPFKLQDWSAASLAALPRYYVMEAGVGMAATVAAMAPDAAETAACSWMNEADLAHYAGEFGRTGFQGGLNWYRRAISAAGVAELRLFAGRRIEVPCGFIAGARDWGVRQVPGALEAMETSACADWRGATLIDGAGHWVQQEAPVATAKAILRFLAELPARSDRMAAP
ncbi:alpha/beta fold hydrolase [Pikeienuella piscinae]|nr:alpha/beta hydrolase [Pikeienuella piscinae]